MLDLVHIRSFAVLADELNFGRAAVRLNITQPPLSRQIRQLEQTLGVTLFQRTSRRVALSPAGAAFLPEARALLDQAEAAFTAARQASRASTGALTIAFAGAATYDLLPRMMDHLRRSLPDIAVDLAQMESTEQEDALRSGRIDLGLSRPLAASPNLHSLLVGREPMMLALPQRHVLAARRRPAINLIAGEPFIAFAPAARYLHDKLNALFAETGIQPRIVQSLTHSQAILSLVSVGIGLAIVPQEARNACFDNVLFKPIDGSLNLTADFHASWAAENRNPAMKDVIRALQQLARK